MEQPVELPRYRCHKIVQAAKILNHHVLPDDGREVLTLANCPVAGQTVSCVAYGVPSGFIKKRGVRIGGYLVRYEDGYESFSPAKAFEEGYTLEESSNLTVSFKSQISPNGELQRITLSKDGATMGLTVEQARSLVEQLSSRLDAGAGAA